MTPKVKIILRSGKDDAVRRMHPWIFSGAVKSMSGPVCDGAHAEVFSNREEYLGSGIYQDGSIAVRLLSFAPEQPQSFDQTFWNDRIAKAYKLRDRIGLTSDPMTNAYRLVHGEGDHLPGLIIDHYNGHLVIQMHSTGLCNYMHEISGALKHVYGDRLKSLYDKSQATLPEEFRQQQQAGGVLFGEPGLTEIRENGNSFHVDIVGGQKTGFFLDQRDNRQLLAQYSKDKTVLNTFCYSGGFSVYALAAGAKEVVSVDSSSQAIELTEKNISLNFGQEARHRSLAKDALQTIKESQAAYYDVIVLDPPAFAKHVHVKHNAVQGYKRLNLAAIEKIKPGGILFTFSCSQVVDLNLFRSTVMSAAILARRKARLLHQVTQPPDHPVNMFHPEGQYLKGLVLLID